MPICSQCATDKQKKEFSNAQLKKRDLRRCSACCNAVMAPAPEVVALTADNWHKNDDVVTMVLDALGPVHSQAQRMRR